MYSIKMNYTFKLSSIHPPWVQLHAVRVQRPPAGPVWHRPPSLSCGPPANLFHTDQAFPPEPAGGARLVNYCPNPDICEPP
jgi:hypothetical protein